MITANSIESLWHLHPYKMDLWFIERLKRWQEMGVQAKMREQESKIQYALLFPMHKACAKCYEYENINMYSIILILQMGLSNQGLPRHLGTAQGSS